MAWSTGHRYAWSGGLDRGRVLERRVIRRGTAEENGESAFGPLFSRITYMRNVFIEKCPSLVKVVLAAGAVIFAMIRWA